MYILTHFLGWRYTQTVIILPPRLFRFGFQLDLLGYTRPGRHEKFHL